jgi:hypothetical protein
MKGQSALLSHAILVSISIVLVFIVVYTFTNIRADYQKFVGDVELNSACFAIKSSIEKIYNPGSYRSPADTEYGNVKITLPQKSAGLKYRTYFTNKTLNIETLGQPKLNASCIIGLDASYSGFTTGGVTRISYVEKANGTKQIMLEQVD